jgi:hypothetical protein
LVHWWVCLNGPTTLFRTKEPNGRTRIVQTWLNQAKWRQIKTVQPAHSYHAISCVKIPTYLLKADI